MIEVIAIHELVDTVISVLDARDPYTYEHSWRVAHLAELIAKKMNIDEKWVDLIHMAAHLHDIGKVAVPDDVLNKPDRLTIDEFEIMKSHPRIGYNIVNKIDVLQETSLYILHHHERWDGRGYPCGLKGKEIPLGARIITIADSFDAMTSARSYQTGISIEDAFKEIKRCRGAQFCPEVVDVFMKLEDEMDKILIEINLEIKHNAFTNEESSLLVRSSSTSPLGSI